MLTTRHTTSRALFYTNVRTWTMVYTRAWPMVTRLEEQAWGRVIHAACLRWEGSTGGAEGTP